MTESGARGELRLFPYGQTVCCERNLSGIPMKTSLILLASAILLAGCETTVVERRPFVTRHYITYRDRDPYYRVYYREPDGRVYYRRHYYDEDPAYVTRVDTRRYYYAPGPIDRTYDFGR